MGAKQIPVQGFAKFPGLVNLWCDRTKDTLLLQFFLEGSSYLKHFHAFDTNLIILPHSIHQSLHKINCICLKKTKITSSRLQNIRRELRTSGAFDINYNKTYLTFVLLCLFLIILQQLHLYQIAIAIRVSYKRKLKVS